MTLPSDDHAARALGAALTALRNRQGLSQEQAGARLGLTGQAWGKYETGRSPGIFRPQVQARLTGALEATPGDLNAIVAAASEGRASVREPPSDWDDAAPVRRLTVSDDHLAPWAGAGVVLEYAPGRWPRPGQGCVIDLKGGVRLVRLFESSDPDGLSVRGGLGFATLERLERDRVEQVSAVTARIE